MMHTRWLVRFSMAPLLAAVVLTAGCGYLGDRNLIKIAKIKDRYITRGDLAKVIYDSQDEDPVIINNKGDELRVLNAYIDEQIKTPLAEEVEQELESQQKTLVSRDIAKQQYFKEHAEDEFESIYNAKNPELLGMTQAELDTRKQQIDLGIDRVLEKLKGDAAVAYRAVQAFKDGSLKITDEEYQREFNLRKEELNRLEWMRFRAFRFPADVPNSETEAANVRKRLDAGEMFETVFDEYAKKNPAWVIESEIENNPNLARFEGFWLNASGAKEGDIIGPVYLPEYQMMAEDAQGRRDVRNMPAAYLVLKVLEHRDPTPLTLDEAKPSLAPSILISKMMQKLRDDNGVEVYEKNLPDPAMFSDRQKRSLA